VRLIKASPAAAGKPVYVNVFAPFTVATQCDDRLLERMHEKDELDAVCEGLQTITAVTRQYMRALARAGADGFFYSNKS
jgi:uroporphyrinogen-III decarboxylase